MKKVAYSVTKWSGNNNYRMKGIGKLDGDNLVLYNGKVLEDVVKRCHPIPYKQNEFKGNYEEYQEIDVECKGSYETIEVCNEYSVWYKFI